MRRHLLTLACVLLLALSTSAQWLQNGVNDIPAYNARPAAKAKLPAILPAAQLPPEYIKYPYQSHAYVLAAKIPRVIYQQPCYCYCDRGHGHTSLHSCFESPHGSQCAACLKELYYSYMMTKQKKTPAQIRTGIIVGEWKSVDLDKAATIN